MFYERTSFGPLRVSLLFLAVLLSTSSGNARDGQWSSTADPHMVVIPVRSVQEITTDLDNAEATRQLAIDHNAQAVTRLNEIASAIEQRERSVDDINRRKDDAKDGTRDAEAASLKIEEEANKQAIDLLKRLRDLREAEVEVAKVQEDHADLSIRVLQTEMDLQEKRIEYGWQSLRGSGDLTQNTAYQVLTELEVNLLKLQQELAGTTRKAASKQQDVVKRRMSLHKAQGKLGM